jgi:hypothetical protein
VPSPGPPPDLDGLLRAALACGDDEPLRAAMLADGGLVDAFAAAVGRWVGGPGEPVDHIDRLEALLDGWAARTPVILPVAAVAAYGQVGAARPDWWHDEITKLRHAATDTRPQVREAVARALQTLLAAADELGASDDPDQRD